MPDQHLAKTLESDTLNPVLIAGTPSWMAAAQHLLTQLQHLKDDWNTYGSMAPNKSALDAAALVLSHLGEMDFKPRDIDPSAENGVCIAFREGDRYADIECFNSGEVLAITSDGKSPSDVWELEPSNLSVMAALNRIRAFLHST